MCGPAIRSYTGDAYCLRAVTGQDISTKTSTWFEYQVPRGPGHVRSYVRVARLLSFFFFVSIQR